ncbi:MAG: cytochrome P450 [Actinomycetota bacterium]
MKVDLYDQDQYVAGVPHETFAWLRKNAPCYFNPEPAGPGFWALTRYADITHASPLWQTFASGYGTNIEDPIGGAELMMVNQDAPKHTRLRSLVKQGFLPKVIRAIEPHVREICTDILDRIASKGDCDLVTEISAELPLQVIAEMLGVPKEERHLVFNWSNTMIGMDDPEYGNSIETATAAAIEMYAYTDKLASIRRSEPRDDLVSILATAEVDGEKLTDMEMDVFFLLLAVAGNETTRNLISGGMLALMENPDQKERLLNDMSLMPTAVEEMLRWVTPVMYFRRTAQVDAEIAGEKIRKGDKVTYWYISANRDEEQFPNAMQFDIGRTPNDHLAFGGGGPHFCIGFSLAQLEIRVMFEELLRRFPDMEMAGPAQRLRSNFINGIKHLPVKFTPESS